MTEELQFLHLFCVIYMHIVIFFNELYTHTKKKKKKKKGYYLFHCENKESSEFFTKN